MDHHQLLMRSGGGLAVIFGQLLQMHDGLSRRRMLFERQSCLGDFLEFKFGAGTTLEIFNAGEILPRVLRLQPQCRHCFRSLLDLQIVEPDVVENSVNVTNEQDGGCAHSQEERGTDGKRNTQLRTVRHGGIILKPVAR